MRIIHTYNSSKRKKTPRGKGWREREETHRKHLKKLGIDPDAKPKKKKFVEYKPKISANHQRSMEHRDKYKSKDDVGGSCHKKEQMVYTGTLIKGIATMHKSNAVPVISQKQAEEISRMGK